MQVIVHGDDFGKDESVTRAICMVMVRGWCDETSLMVNMPYADEAVRIARQNGFSERVGLHLNLTEGVPLTEKILSCRRFCSANGLFNKKFHSGTLGRFFLSRDEAVAVKEEIEAQLSRFVSYEGLMMKIDSHHHVHTDWAIYRILKPLALKYGFRSMRISADCHRVGLLQQLYKIFYNRDVRRHFETTDHFDGAMTICGETEDCISEAMVHPMFVDGVLCDTSTPYERIAQSLNRKNND